jgi:hypothetical protein
MKALTCSLPEKVLLESVAFNRAGFVFHSLLFATIVQLQNHDGNAYQPYCGLFYFIAQIQN